MRRSSIRCSVLLVAFLSGGCQNAAGQQTLSTVGIVNRGGEQQGEFWFELIRIEQRFILDTRATPDLDAVHAALVDSNESGRSILVKFDPESGTFDPGIDVPSFVVRSVEYDGRSIEGMSGDGRTMGIRSPAETALARAVAYLSSGNSDLALPEAEKALSAGILRQSLRSLAFETRGSAALDSVWSRAQVFGEAEDRQLVRALQDFREWSALVPDELEASIAIGNVLSDLGAYDEALAVFEEAGRRWPEHGIRTSTRIAATYRIKGDYDRSLAVLDGLAANGEPPTGMMFHYHRAWTLNLLGRYEEAIVELNRGFESQPDYAGAFERRSCALARLGRLPEALSDRRRANQIMEIHWQDVPPAPAIEHDRAWGQSVVLVLEAAIAAGRSQPMSEPCEGSWNLGDHRRERSAFLPAVG